MRVDEHGVEWFDLKLREDREAFVRAVDALPDPDEPSEEPLRRNTSRVRRPQPNG